MKMDQTIFKNKCSGIQELTENTDFQTLQVGARCTQRTKVYDTPPESSVLGVVAGVGFKLIASKLSSQSAFEVSTKFAFSLSFSVLPSIVYMQFPIILLQFKKCFSHSKVFFYLSHFPYFDPGKHSCPDASCIVIKDI